MIKLEHIYKSFHHTTILNDINLEIKDGEIISIIGPSGSGKSTTMACIVDRINHSREGHIITLEDPLEYLHRHDKCIVITNALRIRMRKKFV